MEISMRIKERNIVKLLEKSGTNTMLIIWLTTLLRFFLYYVISYNAIK